MRWQEWSVQCEARSYVFGQFPPLINSATEPIRIRKSPTKTCKLTLLFREMLIDKHDYFETGP